MTSFMITPSADMTYITCSCEFEAITAYAELGLSALALSDRNTLCFDRGADQAAARPERSLRQGAHEPPPRTVSASGSRAVPARAETPPRVRTLSAVPRHIAQPPTAAATAAR